MNLVNIRAVMARRFLKYSPVNVANVEDLTVDAMHNSGAALELNINWRPSQVRSHREIGDRGDQGHTSSDVVEDTIGARLCEGETHESEGCAGHDRSHRPVPVGSMGGDGNVDMLPVLGVGCRMLAACLTEERRCYEAFIMGGIAYY